MSKQKVRKAVLTDAGYATRFLPITKTLPKSMLPIWDKPITQYIVEECMEAGITEIIMVATEEGKPIYEDYFHNTVQHIHAQLKKQNKESRFEKVRQVFSLPNIIVITQDKSLPYGNGTPALSAKPYIGDEPFIYIYTDDLVLGKSRAKEMIEAYESAPDDILGVIPTKDLPDADVTKYGMIKLKTGDEHLLDYIIEKPKPEDSPSSLVSFSGYVLDPKIFDYLAPKQENLGKDDELWMVDAIHRMAKQHKVLVREIEGEWLTTGDPMSYLETVIKYTLAQNDEDSEDLRDKLMDLLDAEEIGCGDDCQCDDNADCDNKDDHECSCGGNCGCGGHK